MSLYFLYPSPYESIIGFYNKFLAFLFTNCHLFHPSKKSPILNYRHYTTTISGIFHIMLQTHEPKITSEILMNKNYKSPKIVCRNNCNPTRKCTWTFSFWIWCEITNSWVFRTLHVCIPKSQKHAKKKSLYDLTLQIDLSLKKTFGIIMIHIIE